MATPRKILKKEGDKFQLVDKNTSAGSIMDTPNNPKPNRPSAERHETDVWEELLVSVRKKCEERRWQTRQDIGEGPNPEERVGLPKAQEIPYGQAGEEAPHGSIKLGDRAVVSLDDDSLVYSSRPQKTDTDEGSQIETPAVEENSYSVISGTGFDRFGRYLLPKSTKERKISSSESRHQARQEAVDEREKEQAFSRKLEEFPSLDLSEAPKLPEIPTVYRKASGVTAFSSNQKVSQNETNVHDLGVSLKRNGKRPEGLGHDMGLQSADTLRASQQKHTSVTDPMFYKSHIETSASQVQSSLRLSTEGDSSPQVHDSGSQNKALAKVAYGKISRADLNKREKEARRRPNQPFEHPHTLKSSIQSSSEEHTAIRSSTYPRTRPSLSIPRLSGRTSGEEPQILLHEGNVPFTPRRTSGTRFRTSSSKGSASRPPSSEKSARSFLRPGSFDLPQSSHPSSEKPKDPPPPLISDYPTQSGRFGVSMGSGQAFESPIEKFYEPKEDAPSPRSERQLGSSAPEGFPETPKSSFTFEEEPRTPTSDTQVRKPATPQKKLEARSPYANRPSPRSKISFDEPSDDHSVSTTAALIDLCRAGPPPSFDPSETLLPDALNRGRRPELVKKRSFKEICKDIVYRTPSGSTEQPWLKPRAATVSIKEPKETPQRSKSVPRKIEEAFGSFGRSKKKRGKMDDKFAELQVSEQAGQQKTAAEMDDKDITSSTGKNQESGTSQDALRPMSETELPIETDDIDKPQSSLPEALESGVGAELKCTNCGRTSTKAKNKGMAVLTKCPQCRKVFFCTKSGDCRGKHIRDCPIVQRPHTSYRMHSVFLPETLREKADYKIWQGGKYIEMKRHLEAQEAKFRAEFQAGNGPYLKDLRKEIGWSKNKLRRGISKLTEDEVNDLYECHLRRTFMMPLLEPVSGQHNTQHPSHQFHRNTAMLRCLECRGPCAGCGVECCVAKAIELDTAKATIDYAELDAMQSIRAEIDVWVRRGNPSIFAQCTACIAEGEIWKRYCPSCFGVCPLGKDGKGPVCGDVLCAKHQGKLNGPCDWHTPQQLANAGFSTQ